MAQATAAQPITVGVDTHLDSHVAHAGDQLGRRVGTRSVPTTPTGYQDLLAWARGLGQPIAWGVEGTGSYGAALARFLAANGQVVVEVNRPDRQARRRRGKSDPLDAEAAARAVQAGQATVAPKAGTGQVEMIRSLRVARQTAIRARTQTINALKALVVTAPAELREQLRDLPTATLVAAAAALVPGPITSPLAAALLALGTLARRPPGPQPRDQGPDRRAGPAHHHRRPQAGGALRHRPRQRRRAAGRRRGQPPAAPQRGLLCDAVRFLTDPGVLRQDRPAPPQPGWGPPGQRCAVPDRAGAAALPPADQGLPDPSAGRGQAQERNHPVSQALHRPGSLRSAQTPTPRVHHPTQLTSIRASPRWKCSGRTVTGMPETSRKHSTNQPGTRACHGRRPDPVGPTSLALSLAPGGLSACHGIHR